MNIYNLLKKYFGYTTFKDGQEKIVNSILNHNDAIAIMPTGGGKSLCYQLPSIILPGITIVVSPLISLMKDQVDSLNQIGIPATFLNSSLNNLEFNTRLNDILNNKYKLVYLAPERLNNPYFINKINSINISMVAIDEAHCISQWGHDFRPSYREIPNFIKSLNKRPIITAYTATATKKVTEEIINLLELKNPIKSLIGFDRPNLNYSVIKVSDKVKYIKKFINKNHLNQSGIIYCSTRNSVETLTKKLIEEGFSVSKYHGGMNTNEREDNQNKFIKDEVDIIIATNAFGMGIDKPNVRFVIHYNMPQNMESYYQEAGRAGRDGEISNCILMYSPSDIVKQKLLIQNQTIDNSREFVMYENLQYLIDYCHTNNCLRVKILKYFNEKPDFSNCNFCGNCLDNSDMIDITIEAQKILSCIYRVDERYGINMVINVLRGSKNKKVLINNLNQVSTYGIMKDYSNESIREIIMTLISRDYIHLTADRYPILKLTKHSREVLNGKVKLEHKKNLIYNLNTKENLLTNKEIIDNINIDLLNELKNLRLEISKKENIPPFIIFHDSTLNELASIMPITKFDFLNIKGVGEKKYELYGDVFINTIKKFINKNNISKTTMNKPKIERENLDERYKNTYLLYKEGLSLENISRKRNFTTNTIINHLKKCEENGYFINWSYFLSKNKEEKILDIINIFGLNSLKNIKDNLPDNFSYDDINICIIKNKLK